MIDIEKNINQLLEKFPEFADNIQRGTHADYGKRAILTLDNKSNPRFPLIVIIYEDNIWLEMGRGHAIVDYTSEAGENLLNTIALAVEDKVYVTAAYRNQADFNAQEITDFDAHYGAQKIRCQRFHYDVEKQPDVVTSNYLNDLVEYKLFIEKLKKPASMLHRMFSPFKGIIETSNWSGSAYQCFRI